MVELDSDKREALFIELERILAKDVPALFLSHSRPSTYFAPKSVRNLGLNFLFPDLRAVWLETTDEIQN